MESNKNYLEDIKECIVKTDHQNSCIQSNLVQIIDKYSIIQIESINCNQNEFKLIIIMEMLSYNK